MKVTMEFDPEFGLMMLNCAAGSMEQMEINNSLTDEQIMQKCFDYGAKQYGFSNAEVEK